MKVKNSNHINNLVIYMCHQASEHILLMASSALQITRASSWGRLTSYLPEVVHHAYWYRGSLLLFAGSNIAGTRSFPQIARPALFGLRSK